MTQELADLDAVVPEDVGIKWNDEVYLLPGDIDSETIATLLALSGRSRALVEKATEKPLTAKEQKEFRQVSEQFNDTFEGLFRIRQPDLAENWLAGMTSVQLQTLIERVFSYYLNVPTPAGGDRPTKTPPSRPSSRPSPRRSSRRAPRASASSKS
jgi:hypothetical protein